MELVRRESITDLDGARAVAERLRKHMKRDVMGRDDVIELVLIALLSGGHVLLEDYPGSGKTTLAKALGSALTGKLPDADPHQVAFRRIQFTPDMLPSDITGVMIFDTDTNQFHFRPGPIFAHTVLVDEINRTTPKVQSALLESMAEGQVTIDNDTHALSSLFFVIATQNPLDSVGTYPLPVAQLDRFLFKIKMKDISREAEIEVVNNWGRLRKSEVMEGVSLSSVVEARRLIREQVKVSDEIVRTMVDIIRNIREDKRCVQGASTRSLVQALPALQCAACLKDRDYVSVQDIKDLIVPLLRHRLTMVPGVSDASEIIFSALEKPLDTVSKKLMQS